ncbi:MAG: glutaminyl-peptide cyclotransferase [Gammaproteobacteria bacterium]|nr:glutaminyl-peptide cyclotransferase [Gammaproteobacteria bacterium]
MNFMRTTGFGVVAWLCAAQVQADIPVYDYTVVQTYPHNISSFTQGLQIHDGYLYEGTGLEGRSSLSQINLADGKVLKSKRLAQQYFGEGISIVGDKIFQLTWQSNIVFVYDLATFNSVTSHYHPTEGWGLTYDGSQLILSDGSASLQFIDPETFQVARKVEVQLEGQPVNSLNELEYINGEVWANVWQTNEIVRIDPQSGAVTGIVDLAGLVEQTRTGGDGAVLNGIAWVPNAESTATSGSGRLFVTGKLWGNLFEIELVPRQ